MIKISKNKNMKLELRNFFLLMIASVGSAVLLVYFLVNFYASTGTYQLKNVLLSPKVLRELSYNDVELSGNPRFVFDRVEIEYFKPRTARWESASIPEAAYTRLYHQISNDYSLPPGEENQFKRNFQSTQLLNVRIMVKPLNEERLGSKVFQEVNFSRAKDLFRVHLRSEGGGQWIYFQHPGIYALVMKTLGKK